MRLARREKYFIAAAICFIIIFFLFQFLISPFFEKRERLEKGILAKGEELKEMAALIQEYQSLEMNSQGIDRLLAGRKKGFTLFSFLEQEAGMAQIKDHIKSNS